MNKRLFYLDFIRTIAAILIVITHFNAAFVFYSNPPQFNKIILTEYPFGIYIGNLGVSLFLIISGCSLMYIYGDKIELKNFYKKRFLSIYPMFWIAYTIFFFVDFCQKGGINPNIPREKFILTLFGMDGYLSEYGLNFYILGEWFLGFIVLFYIIFPILRWMLKKNEIATWIIVFVVFSFLLLNYNFKLNISKCIFIRLPELLFGMSFVKNKIRINKIHLLIAVIILILNICLKPNVADSIQTLYVGISFFIVLYYCSQYTNKEIINSVCKWISKYSYAIFLVHHVTIVKLQSLFDLYKITKLESVLLFLLCCIVTLILSIILFQINNEVSKIILSKKKQTQ